jgi:hypothetical protein
MSNLSTEVFGDMNYLYEHIANRDAQQLNENSEHYDEETTELVADILATISSSMVYEGYSANAIITFLATSSEQDIIEKYLNFDENILTESTISEDYIVEQLEIFDFAINEGLVGGAIKLLGRIASKPARMRVDKILSGAKNPERARELLQKTAQKSARNANVGGYSSTMSPVGGGNLTGKQSAELLTKAKLGQGVQKVKDIAKGAKAALTSPTAKKIGLGALGVGALGLSAGGGAYYGAKMAGAGNNQGPSPLIAKPSEQAPTTPPKAPEESKPPSNNSAGGSPSGGNGTPSKGTGSPSTTKKPVFTKQTGNPEKDMKTWAAANPKLAAAKAERDRTRGTQQSDNPLMKDMPGTRPLNSPSVQSPEVSKLGSGNQSLTDNPNAFKAATPPAPKESDKKSDKKSETNESYGAYDLVLEYLFDNGHANTIAEAEYLMTELDESFIQSLVETYHANLLAEEVEAWVNELVEEGYDLSKYTWDDMVDYYFSEAKVDKYLDDKLKKSVGDDETGRSIRKDIKISHRRQRGSVTLDTPRQRRLSKKLRDNRDRNEEDRRNSTYSDHDYGDKGSESPNLHA